MRILTEFPTEFDYVFLMDRLKGLSRPRDRVTQLLQTGQILRVKKGLYVTGDRESPFSRELLGNLVYGPSYVSLEYALSYYGLIPEAVRTVTSVTTQKNKLFDTPVGRFEYRHLAPRYFSRGVARIALEPDRSFLIALPEKALFDTLYLRSPKLRADEIEEYLFQHLRVDESRFDELSFGSIGELITTCPRSSIRALRELLGRRAVRRPVRG